MTREKVTAKAERLAAALELLYAMAVLEVESNKGKGYDGNISIEDINKVFIVAGLPITSGKYAEEKEVEVIEC